MSKGFSSNNVPAYPSAPTNYDMNVLSERPPPPSYEESQKMETAGAMPTHSQSTMYPQFTQFYQPVHQLPPPQYGAGQSNVCNSHMAQQPYLPSGALAYAANYPNFSNAPAVGYAAPSLGHQQYMTTDAGASKHVIEFAKGAELRTTKNGAISVPPPPPGCAPTPAQIAAMQGQAVLVKEPKKRGFFS